jgi:uncharacterized membrane protein
MNIAGIGAAQYRIICFNLVIIIAWPGLALLSMRGRALARTAQALWVLIIVAVLFVGALAYCSLRPGAPAAIAA